MRDPHTRSDPASETHAYCVCVCVTSGTPTVCVTIWAVLRLQFDDLGLVGDWLTVTSFLLRCVCVEIFVFPQVLGHERQRCHLVGHKGTGSGLHHGRNNDTDLFNLPQLPRFQLHRESFYTKMQKVMSSFLHCKSLRQEMQNFYPEVLQLTRTFSDSNKTSGILTENRKTTVFPFTPLQFSPIN